MTLLNGQLLRRGGRLLRQRELKNPVSWLGRSEYDPLRSVAFLHTGRSRFYSVTLSALIRSGGFDLGALHDGPAENTVQQLEK
jgi:hypothetical protein